MHVEFKEEEWIKNNRDDSKSVFWYANPSDSDSEIIANIEAHFPSRKIKYILREPDQIVAVLKSTFWTRLTGRESGGWL